MNLSHDTSYRKYSEQLTRLDQLITSIIHEMDGAYNMNPGIDRDNYIDGLRIELRRLNNELRTLNPNLHS